MASIQSLGVGSGLLTTELVDDIIAAEREATDLRLDRRQAEVEAEISAYGEVQSALSTLQSAASGLSRASSIREASANSSNEAWATATTNQLAETGNYALRINNIAEAQTLASQRYSATTDTVGTGTLTFRFGGFEYDGSDNITGFTQNQDAEEFSIDISSGNNTLTGIRDAINRANKGVQASLVNDGQGYRLLVSSEKTGEQNALEITASGDAGLQALAYNQAQDDPNNNMALTQKAMDADLFVNGLQITSASNELTEVARGTTINLKEATNGSTVNISVTRDPSGVVEKVEGFIEAYNEFKDLYDEYTRFNADSGESGILLGDSALRQVQSQVRRSLGQLVEGLDNSSFRTLADIGIFSDRTDNFKLALDADKLTAAFNESIDDFTGLFAERTEATDSLINVITKGMDTQPGSYDVNITQVATQGQFEGQSSAALDFSQPVTIGGGNDEFRMNLDGTTATVNLEQGDYATGDDLALMIQNSINNTETFQDRGRSVTVDFDAANQSLNITSSRYGGASQVSFVELDPTVANTLGFTLPGQGGVTGQSFTTLGERAFAATTSPASKEVFTDDGFDLSADPVSFDLTLGGTASSDGTYSFTLNEDLSDQVDNNGTVTTDRDRDDMLSYINSELTAQGLGGVVSASFNNSNRLVFSTNPEAGAQTLELSNVSAPSDDVFGLAGAQGTATSGVSIAANTEFQVSFSNRYGQGTSGAVTVPEGTYETPEALATAIQTAINNDPSVQGSAVGAKTLAGSRPIGQAIDFDARASSFEFEYNGTALNVRVEANAGSDVNGDGNTDNLDSIQAALDTALTNAGFTAGDVLAREENGGLVLETAATGSSETLNVTNDGRGDQTAAGAQVTGGVDFSADPGNFTLRVDGVDIDVALNEDLTGASQEDTLAYIQQQLDEGLVGAGGGGEFQAGDVVARLNANDELYFETRSKNGERTSSTFGALAAIEVTAASGSASSDLGIAVGGPQLVGADAFGLERGRVEGFDAQASVNYNANSGDRGSFSVAFDNATTVEFAAVSPTAASQLGFTLPDGTETQVATGKDVEGTINGVKANGRGQVLVAGSGTEAATNGYLLGSPGFDWSQAVELDGNSNSFQVTVDGVQSGTIELNETVYASGSALAQEMTSKINQDTNLASQFKSVEVQFDPNTNTFGIFSASTGEDSRVRLTSIDGPLSNVTGLSTTSESVQGKPSTGEGNPAEGLQIRVLGGQTGDRGSIDYIEGVFSQLGDLFANMLNSRGTVTTRLDRLDQELQSVNEQRTQLDQRMAAQEARLRSQFAFNDRIISQLQSTENFLTQQFEAMNASND